MPGNKSFPLFVLLIIFHFLSILTNSSDISHESLSRTEIVLFKDITIDPKLNISARLYLPKNATPLCRLPLLVYFHGGSFITGSPFSPTYHNYLNSLVAKANVVAVSVDYRLAPAYPLPIAYEDSWLALKWIFSHCKNNGGTETWLKNYVDFEHVYLGGDSAGGNIAHNMAIRAGLAKSDEGIALHGMFLNCPYFWGKIPIGNETADPIVEARAGNVWIRAYPNSTGLDDPLVNPAMDPNLSKLGCKKVLVFVAGIDIFKDRGWYYAKVLKKSKWDGIVKVVEVKGEMHIFNLNLPDTPKAKKMLKQVALFLNDKGLVH